MSDELCAESTEIQLAIISTESQQPSDVPASSSNQETDCVSVENSEQKMKLQDKEFVVDSHEVSSSELKNSEIFSGIEAKSNMDVAEKIFSAEENERAYSSKAERMNAKIINCVKQSNLQDNHPHSLTESYQNFDIPLSLTDRVFIYISRDNSVQDMTLPSEGQLNTFNPQEVVPKLENAEDFSRIEAKSGTHEAAKKFTANENKSADLSTAKQISSNIIKSEEQSIPQDNPSSTDRPTTKLQPQQLSCNVPVSSSHQEHICVSNDISEQDRILTNKDQFSASESQEIFSNVIRNADDFSRIEAKSNMDETEKKTSAEANESASSFKTEQINDKITKLEAQSNPQDNHSYLSTELHRLIDIVSSENFVQNIKFPVMEQLNAFDLQEISPKLDNTVDVFKIIAKSKMDASVKKISAEENQYADLCNAEQICIEIMKCEDVNAHDDPLSSAESNQNFNTPASSSHQESICSSSEIYEQDTILPSKRQHNTFEPQEVSSGELKNANNFSNTEAKSNMDVTEKEFSIEGNKSANLSKAEPIKITNCDEQVIPKNNLSSSTESHQNFNKQASSTHHEPICISNENSEQDSNFPDKRQLSTFDTQNVLSSELKVGDFSTIGSKLNLNINENEFSDEENESASSSKAEGIKMINCEEQVIPQINPFLSTEPYQNFYTPASSTHHESICIISKNVEQDRKQPVDGQLSIFETEENFPKSENTDYFSKTEAISKIDEIKKLLSIKENENADSSKEKDIIKCGEQAISLYNYPDVEEINRETKATLDHQVDIIQEQTRVLEEHLSIIDAATLKINKTIDSKRSELIQYFKTQIAYIKKLAEENRTESLFQLQAANANVHQETKQVYIKHANILHDLAEVSLLHKEYSLEFTKLFRHHATMFNEYSQTISDKADILEAYADNFDTQGSLFRQYKDLCIARSQSFS